MTELDELNSESIDDLIGRILTEEKSPHTETEVEKLKKLNVNNNEIQEKNDIIARYNRHAKRKSYNIMCGECGAKLTTQFIFSSLATHKGKCGTETLFCEKCGYYVKRKAVIDNGVKDV